MSAGLTYRLIQGGVMMKTVISDESYMPVGTDVSICSQAVTDD